MTILNEHKGDFSIVQLVELENKSFCVNVQTVYDLDFKRFLYNRNEKKQAIEFYNVLKNINN